MSVKRLPCCHLGTVPLKSKLPPSRETGFSSQETRVSSRETRFSSREMGVSSRETRYSSRERVKKLQVRLLRLDFFMRVSREYQVECQCKRTTAAKKTSELVNKSLIAHLFGSGTLGYRS